MLEALKKSIFGILSYLIICGLIFLGSFSFYTKKFPPDLKQVRSSIDSITKLPESLGVIQKQQSELLKIDFQTIPAQLTTTNDQVIQLQQKLSTFESQNNYLNQKISSLEQNQIQLLQRVESLERSRQNR